MADNNPKIEDELVSNNELARMIAEGFHGVDQRFNGIENRMSGMATKDDLVAVRKELLEHILIVDQRVTTVQQGMIKVGDYLELEKRVDTLGDTVKSLAVQH